MRSNDGRPRAVFMDRDGVLNPLVWNPAVAGYDSPRLPEEVMLLPGVSDALERLAKADFLLMVVSNQPSAAKGKCGLEDLEAVHKAFDSLLHKSQSFRIHEYYYCYHHPESVVTDLKARCECRKPGNLFLRQARDGHGVDLASSWFIGDRDVDILCGQSLRLRTVLLEYPLSKEQRNGVKTDARAADIRSAVDFILENQSVPL